MVWFVACASSSGSLPPWSSIQICGKTLATGGSCGFGNLCIVWITHLWIRATDAEVVKMTIGCIFSVYSHCLGSQIFRLSIERRQIFYPVFIDSIPIYSILSMILMQSRPHKSWSPITQMLPPKFNLVPCPDHIHRQMTHKLKKVKIIWASIIKILKTKSNDCHKNMSWYSKYTIQLRLARTYILYEALILRMALEKLGDDDSLHIAHAGVQHTKPSFLWTALHNSSVGWPHGHHVVVSHKCHSHSGE